MANKSICAVVSLAFLWLASLSTGAARIKEAKEAIATYPFSDPDPVPILARSGSWERNARLYPYHSFDGFSETAVQQDWTVVRLENPYIKLAVLSEVGGKIWGASEKSSGKEFIYTNHVLKFRQIALRGPWTSGGVEFNFGIVGHAPSCATPVDYLVRRNADGSVSCIVGAMDLPSRTRWAVTITLPKDKAFVETRAFWYHPTPLNQSYYVSVGLTDDAVRVLEYARDHPTACYWLGNLLFDKTSTLPFEGAREVHGLFVKCRVQLGLQEMMAAEYASAVEYLQGSKQYPERLGTGRPYDPDLKNAGLSTGPLL